MSNINFVQRAYELADSGNYSGVSEIRAVMTREGFSLRQLSQLSGKATDPAVESQNCGRPGGIQPNPDSPEKGALCCVLSSLIQRLPLRPRTFAAGAKASGTNFLREAFVSPTPGVFSAPPTQRSSSPAAQALPGSFCLFKDRRIGKEWKQTSPAFHSPGATANNC
jgi:hypothetical protein